MKKFHGEKFSCYGPFPRKFNTWRKRGAGARGRGVWKRLVHCGCHIYHEIWEAAIGAVTPWWQVYLLISARTVRLYCPYGPCFPTRCGTDGFFHFSICCSNCLGWYWGRQRTPWIRKTVMVFRWKKFVHVIFAVTDNREYFLTAKISRYTCMVLQFWHK